MDTRATAILLIVIGFVVILGGLLLLAGGLDWFGRLPGDIRIERGNTRIYIPIASMILISIVLNLLLYIILRLF